MAIELLIEIEAPIILQAVQSGVTVGGDMLQDTYDPTGVEGDAFDMANMANVAPTIVNVAAYTVLATDRKLHVTYSLTGACTITIPTVLITTKFDLLIKDGGLNATTNNITVVGEGGETIDGDSEWIINGDGDWLSLYSDSTNLFIKG